MFKMDLEKAEEPETKLSTSVGSLKKQESSRKTFTSALLTMPKPLAVWITTNCRKFWRRWEYQTTWSASWEICMQVRKQQLELDLEPQTVSKLGKEYVKAVYGHHAYLTYMQSTSWETLGSKITADGNCSHEIKWHLLLGRKVTTNLDSLLKRRDITLPTKVYLVKALIFLVVMCGCESWTIMKVECWRIDAFELWCWRRLWRVPWTARRSSQSLLKEISPEYSLEGLRLKLKLQ